jgi:hypothetical protein
MSKVAEDFESRDEGEALSGARVQETETADRLEGREAARRGDAMGGPRRPDEAGHFMGGEVRVGHEPAGNQKPDPEVDEMGRGTAGSLLLLAFDVPDHREESEQRRWGGQHHPDNLGLKPWIGLEVNSGAGQVREPNPEPVGQRMEDVTFINACLL